MNFLKIISLCILVISLSHAGDKGDKTKGDKTKCTSENKSCCAPTEALLQTKCPIMGDDIDKKLFVEKNGKKIYMCCEACRKEITENFDENYKKIAALSQKTGVKTLAAQTICPVMGGDIDKSLFVDKDGERIYMCCEHCRKELTDNFDQNVHKLTEKGQKPETL